MPTGRNPGLTYSLSAGRSDGFDFLVSQRLTDVDGRVITLRKDPFAVLAIGEGVVEEDDCSAVAAAEAEVTLIPRCLFEPAEVGLADIHGGAAASANDFLRPIGPNGNNLHASAPEVIGGSPELHRRRLAHRLLSG